jgi:hypothetical protein
LAYPFGLCKDAKLYKKRADVEDRVVAGSLSLAFALKVDKQLRRID